MKYLMDVNALLAMYHANHYANALFHAWHARQGALEMASCAICDLGFIRISMRIYGFSMAGAESALAAIKRHDVRVYIRETPEPRLARWVLSHKQTTDAYLCQLAAANGMKLATFDEGIRDESAVLIG